MKKILVAEDDKNELDSIRSSLEQAGYEVIAAADGEAASLILSSTPLDLAILDIAMPIRSGMQLLELIRTNKQISALPVIILTNLDTDDTMLRQINRDQPAYYLIKANVQLSDLIEKVKLTIGQ